MPTDVWMSLMKKEIRSWRAFLIYFLIRGKMTQICSWKTSRLFLLSLILVSRHVCVNCKDPPPWLQRWILSPSLTLKLCMSQSWFLYFPHWFSYFVLSVPEMCSLLIIRLFTSMWSSFIWAFFETVENTSDILLC